MSIKKRILLAIASVACLATSVVYAGGAEPVDVVPAPMPGDMRYLYLEINPGWADSGWRDINGFAFPFAPQSSNNSSGFTFGLDGGFMFTRYIGLELGGYVLPTANGPGSGLFPFGVGNLSVNSWFAYAGGKLAAPIFENFEVFGKVAGAYRNFNYQGPAAPAARNNSYWTPLFGAGAQYGWNSFTVDAQYLRVPGYREATPITRRAPAANLYTLGIGYRFNF